MSDLQYNNYSSASECISRMLKYAIMFVFVVIAAYTVPKQILKPHELIIIGLVASTTFSVLDIFAPSLLQ